MEAGSLWGCRPPVAEAIGGAVGRRATDSAAEGALGGAVGRRATGSALDGALGGGFGRRATDSALDGALGGGFGRRALPLRWSLGTAVPTAPRRGRLAPARGVEAEAEASR